MCKVIDGHCAEDMCTEKVIKEKVGLNKEIFGLGDGKKQASI